MWQEKQPKYPNEISLTIKRHLMEGLSSMVAVERFIAMHVILAIRLPVIVLLILL